MSSVDAAAGPATPQPISFSDCRILVVDDSRFSRDILARFLGWVGITKVAFAADGEEGLKLLEASGADLVILDIDMPKLNGFETCRRIRQTRAFADIPVLMQTSPASDPAGVKCFEAGATDIISKPVNPGECMARVRLHLEKQFFMRNLTSFHRRLQSDLKLARSMQFSLIPDQRRLNKVSASRNLIIEGHFEPSDELGGDFWTMFELDEHRLGILVVDFSGHGISAAINTFRFHTLIERIPPQGYEPAEWLTMINRPLKDLLPVGQFATCFYCILNTRFGSLSYAAAGAPSPVLYHNGDISLLDASGLMLGVSTTPLLSSDTIPFPPGASLLLYSDAMTEAVDAGGHLIGETGLIELARQAYSHSTDRLPRLLAGFDRLAERPLADDLTAISLTRL
jgi:phosphoserine phosphatase RsbU/P